MRNMSVGVGSGRPREQYSCSQRDSQRQPAEERRYASEGRAKRAGRAACEEMLVSWVRVSSLGAMNRLNRGSCASRRQSGEILVPLATAKPYRPAPMLLQPIRSLQHATSHRYQKPLSTKAKPTGTIAANALSNFYKAALATAGGPPPACRPLS
jgi:hypothetical protein